MSGRVHDAEMCFSVCLALTLFTPIQYCHCLVVLSAHQSNSQPRTCQHPQLSLIHHRLMCCDSKAQRKGSPTVCPDCCVFHQGEFLNITRTCHVQRITIILHSSVGPHASSNHPDPEIMDIYSAAITDKREWNGENGRTESVMGLLFKDGHYRGRNLNQKYDLGRQWENKNQDIRQKKKKNL